MPDVTYHRIPSRLGALLVTDHGRGLSGLYFPDHRRGPRLDPSWRHDAGPFLALEAALAAYLRGEPTGFDLPLDLRGTDFQVQVWTRLRSIPFGGTISYGEMARAMGRPGGARAVAAAVARNPVSIVVPCHRVIGADGRLTGYAGGIERKQDLLAMERAA